jgi:hypothetical protein
VEKDSKLADQYKLDTYPSLVLVGGDSTPAIMTTDLNAKDIVVIQAVLCLSLTNL